MDNHSHSLKRWIIMLGASLCVLVSIMVFLIWRDGQSTGSASLSNADVTNIIVQRIGFDDIRLSKTEGQWQLDSPCRLTANAQRLSPLLSALTASAFQYTANEVDLEAAGLTSPQAVIFINDVEHRIGNTDLNGDRRYLQRGNIVEFTPEWVLSLVNGGVTALAQLEVFTEPLSSLSITDDRGKSKTVTLPEELVRWQNLSARQIATWPLTDVNLPMKNQLRSTDSSGSMRSYTVHTNDSLTAIRLDDAPCAYILSADDLPQ
ncbi:MAG: hypothetical protein AB8B64_25600 [Granulosicoccus sp.]